jgi:hypothetical protein
MLREERVRLQVLHCQQTPSVPIKYFAVACISKIKETPMPYQKNKQGLKREFLVHVVEIKG